MTTTRFAPSPTGYMHIGNLRTALYAYLLAKHDNGNFILRIEDTDRERFIEGATDIIKSTLAITGLNYDEGPDVGGNHGPYVQSERKPILSSLDTHITASAQRKDLKSFMRTMRLADMTVTAVISPRKKLTKSLRKVFPSLFVRKCLLMA